MQTMKSICIECQFYRREKKRLKETHKRKYTTFLHPLPQQIQLNLPRHTHTCCQSSRSYRPYQYFSSISLSYFPGLCTLHTACTHCSPCSFLAPFNQSQQATFISFPHLMLHQASWLAGTAELFCASLMVCGLVVAFFFV